MVRIGRNLQLRVNISFTCLACVNAYACNYSSTQSCFPCNFLAMQVKITRSYDLNVQGDAPANDDDLDWQEA